MKSVSRSYRWRRGSLAEGQATLPNITITEIASLPDEALRDAAHAQLRVVTTNVHAYGVVYSARSDVHFFFLR
jgi:hypothetical protein